MLCGTALLPKTQCAGAGSAFDLAQIEETLRVPSPHPAPRVDVQHVDLRWAITACAVVRWHIWR
jgi:hypothetical protein